MSRTFFNLNTSYVKVQLLEVYHERRNLKNLNTSYVKVQLPSGEIIKKYPNPFKYILC